MVKMRKSLDGELNDFLTGEKEEQEGFKIDSLAKASWAFRKVKENEEAIEEIENLAGYEKSKIDEWVKSESKKHKDDIRHFKIMLIEYYKTLKEEDPKAKLSTPNGKVTSRKRQPKYEFDEDRTLDYLKENKPELVEVKEKFNKTDVKKELTVTDDYQVVDENGEILDFVKATPQTDSYTIKTE